MSNFDLEPPKAPGTAKKGFFSRLFKKKSEDSPEIPLPDENVDQLRDKLGVGKPQKKAAVEERRQVQKTMLKNMKKNKKKQKSKNNLK
jgi:hypothetical protein